MSGLSRELALRIGLAARAIPGLAVAEMMTALVHAAGLPLTAAALAGLDAATLRRAGGPLARASRQDMRAALDLLNGRRPVCADPPPACPPPAARPLPGVRVAVASNSGEAADGDFSTCARFLIYRLDAHATELIDVRAPAADGPRRARDDQRTLLLHDCDLLCACRLGNTAASRLIGAGVQPLRLAYHDSARDALRPLQQVLASAPPPWLARALDRASGQTACR